MVIMPTGKNYYDWSLGKETKTVKTAGAGKKATQTTQTKGDRDPMYEAAEKFLANRKPVKKAQLDLGGDLGGVPKADVEVDMGVPTPEIPTEVTDKGDFGGKDVAEVSDVKDEGGSVQQVVEEVNVLLDEAKGKLQGIGGDSEEAPAGDGSTVDEIEFEIGGDGEGDKEIPGVDADKAEDKGEEESGIPKKSEGEDKPPMGDKETKTECPEKCEKPAKSEKECPDKCAEKKEEPKKDGDKTACASSIGELTKMSEISPTTKKKIYTYWAEYLNYPKDFCKLMVTDYEKK